MSTTLPEGRTRPARREIEAHLLKLLEELSRDWDYGVAIGAGTGLFGDLGYESLDAVILGTAIQEHYDRAMPFAELLADVGQRPVRELTVGELIAFIEAHLPAEVPE